MWMKSNISGNSSWGVFTVIAMTGLDQDMMQRNLSCKNFRDSQKHDNQWYPSPFNCLIPMLGVLLFMFTARHGIQNPVKSDELFPMIATGGYFPVFVGILFIIGLISSAYATAGPHLPRWPPFTVDILEIEKKRKPDYPYPQTGTCRNGYHHGLVIIIFNLLIITSVSMPYIWRVIRMARYSACSPSEYLLKEMYAINIPLSPLSLPALFYPA